MSPLQEKPVIHGRDHSHRGPDPSFTDWEDVGGSGGGGGGGIQFDVDNVGGWLHIQTTETSGSWDHLELKSVNGRLLMNSGGTRLEGDGLALVSDTYVDVLAVNEQITLQARDVELGAIFMSVGSFAYTTFSMIGESGGGHSGYPQRIVLVEMPVGSKFVVASADYTSNHGDRPFLVVDHGFTDTATYHIQSGATWVADL